MPPIPDIRRKHYERLVWAPKLPFTNKSNYGRLSESAGGQPMGTTLRFLEEPGVTSSVLDWFVTLPDAPEVIMRKDGAMLLFREFGPLHRRTDGTFDAKKSPLVNLFMPQLHRGTLHSVGEVHFLPTPATSIPEIKKVVRDFRKWLSGFDLVYDSRRAPTTEFGYYLEGSIQNFESPIYALPSGWAQLKSGRYFIAHDESERVLERICRTLRLRGVECE